MLFRKVKPENLKLIKKDLSKWKDRTKKITSILDKSKDRMIKDNFIEKVSPNMAIYFLSSITTLDLVKKDLKEIRHDVKHDEITDKTIKTTENLYELAKINFDRNEELYKQESEEWKEIKDKKFHNVRTAVKELAFYFRDLVEEINGLFEKLNLSIKEKESKKDNNKKSKK